MSRPFAKLALSLALILAAAAAGACRTAGTVSAARPAAPPTPAAEESVMDRTAEPYVKLVLALGQHDSDTIDAYYGPPEWQKEAVAAGKRPLPELRQEAAALLADLAAHPPAAGADELLGLRHAYLTAQITALAARIDFLNGVRRSFDDESRELYGVVAPTYDEKHFQEILDRLSALLPGDGPLLDRLEAFRARFNVPSDRLEAVFSAAIAECRKRTAEHFDLPRGEDFTVAYVTGKSWSAYNWYQGKFKSRIEVNTDLPVGIDRALDLACHEGYPGHHVYNLMLEQKLVEERGWVEYAVYPLFSPQSLIAEGTANFGIEVAFPGEERVRFEHDVLFPKAGLDPAEAPRFYAVQKLLKGIAYAGNEAARGYLDGRLTREQEVDWLMRYALNSRERAEQRSRFIDQYRSYVINYNYGEDLVREYIEKRGGTPDRPEVRWREFERLISSPRLPAGLR
jgi:hypothetical protein